MKESLKACLLLALGAFSFGVFSYEPCQRRLPLALDQPQAAGAKTKAEPAELACEKKAIPAWRVAFMAGESAPDPLTWAPLESKAWKEDEGLIFQLRPDGSSRYLSLMLLDAATKEIFSYGVTMRDPACREVFIPFALLTLGGKPFRPQEHARVSIGWGLNDAPKSDLVFTAGGFFVGRLNPAEMAWPASTPPFVGTPVYIEKYEGAPSYRVLKGALAKPAAGPPATGIAGSLDVSFPSAQSEIRWEFADTSRWQFFDGMTLWFKSGTAGTRFVMDLLATRLDGRGTVLFRHDFLAGGQGWDVEHIEWDDFLDDKGHNIEPDEFGRIVLSVRPANGQKLPLHIWIGPFRVDDE